MAAGAGAVTALLVLPALVPAPLSAVASALPAGFLIWCSAATVIVPGLVFVAAVEQAGAVGALGAWLRDLRAATPVKVLALVVGIAPALESLTGFGVSLVVTVPALLALLPPAQALPVALVGMAVMPWGTLGLATLVGAQLAELSPARLGMATALVGAGVFAWAALLATWRVGRHDVQASVTALATGLGFTLVLAAAHRVVGVELAAVVAGTAVAALLLGRLPGGRPPLAAVGPFLGLVVLVLLLRAATPFLPSLEFTSGHARFAPLATPGPALLLAGVLVARRRLAGLVGTALRRAARPLATILVFLVLAQLVAASGTLTRIHELVVAGPAAAVVVAALTGGLSGWITASGIAGNALAMTDAIRLGELFDLRLPFAAVQNAAAGHAAPGSIPITAMVLAIAGSPHGGQERPLLRFAVFWALANVGLVALGGLVAIALVSR